MQKLKKNLKKNDKHMKKILFSLLALTLLTISITSIVLFHRAKKEVTEQHKLEALYYQQNTAFELCTDLSQRYYYHGTEEMERNWIAIELFVYNNTHNSYHLTMDEVLDYLSEEYDSNGKPRIYSQPENINKYIQWNIHGHGYDSALDFSHHFIDYLKSKNSAQYWELSYEDLLVALDEYQNDPAYFPPEKIYYEK